MDRTAAFQSQQRQRRITHKLRSLYAMDFFNALTGPELLEKTEALLPAHRERLYPPTVTLAMFMKQALETDRSCQKAVDAWAVSRAAQGLRVQSVRTGGYCKARQRLPLEMPRALTRETGRVLCAQAHAVWRWHGRTVKLADGSGISMPDTDENQRGYPQPSSQAPGVGCPAARIAGVICLSTGAVLDAAIGPLEGVGRSELDLFRSLLGTLSPGEVLLGDSLYCSYFLIAMLQAAGVDVLLEQHGGRISDFRRGQRLAPRDHRVRWLKSNTRPPWLTREQYHAFPDEITVREVQVQGRVLVTTMLDHRQVPKSELAQLYQQRWNVELDLRNIKTTLGMEVLSCHTPHMVEKEMWVYLLAYNLIRLLMAQAAHNAGMHPREISFKHTVQLWTQWTTHHLTSAPQRHHADLFKLIAQVKVGWRPGRLEPRARKRRPKSYPWLKVSRAQARWQMWTYGHLLAA